MAPLSIANTATTDRRTAAAVARPTRADVARLAGVSPATVSYVVNSGPRAVTAETRKRVEAAIAALGYRPNAIAQSLVRRRSQLLGLIVPDNANPFFAELARAVEDVAFARGYTVVLCNASLDPRRELAYVDLLVEKQADGVILASNALAGAQLAPFTERGVPLVVLNRPVAEPGCVAVRIDNVAGGRLATGHLAAHGYDRIACVAGPATSRGAGERVEGHRRALAEAGLLDRPEWTLHGAYSAESGQERARRLLTGRERPRAIAAHADLIAMGVLRAAWELGLRVPDDLALVGFDDIALAGMATPPLTTVAQPISAIARTAVEILVGQVAGAPNGRPRSRRLPIELVIRRSCGCQPA